MKMWILSNIYGLSGKREGRYFRSIREVRIFFKHVRPLFYRAGRVINPLRPSPSGRGPLEFGP